MQRINDKFVTCFFVISVLCTMSVEAATIYVDKDNACPGLGTSNAPFCNLQRGFDAVRPGDVVRIRDSATPYDEKAMANRSGTSTAPIIVEPDSGHRPILRYTGINAQVGVIEIRDADYWHIKGLTFDGSGVQTSRYAVLLYAFTRDITGHQLLNNTFRNWGGTDENTLSAAAIVLRPSYARTAYNPFYVRNSVISDNTFNGNAQSNIHLTQSKDVIIERNTIQDTRCGRKPNGTVGATGIKAAADSVGIIIRNNIVHDFQSSDSCLLNNQGMALYVGIYCDTGPTRGEVTGNTVYNIDKGRSSTTNVRGSNVNSVGIFIESRCHDWKVHHNIVYNVGTFGLRNGSKGSGNPDRTEWTHNTVLGIGRTALWVPRGNNLIIKNNIFAHNQGAAAIELSDIAITQGPHDIDYNLYWDMQSGQKVGRWGDFTTRNLTNWQQSCNCDSKALSINPLFVSLAAGSEDLTLSSSSPARGAGTGGVDIGALGSSAGLPGSLPAPPSKAPPAPTLNSVKP